jgi:ribonuclease P protein component
MRALFLENEKKLQNGRYIFVAKEGIDTVAFEKLQRDFSKVIRNAHGFKK